VDVRVELAVRSDLAHAVPLQEASHKLAEAVYAQATAQAQASATGGNGATTPDDEVVEEGEYEVVDEEAKTS